MDYPAKIQLTLTYKHDKEDIGIFTEKVDAVKVGVFYKLVHVPAFAPNIAYGDIVKVEFEDGEFHFEELVEESGFSVAHIIVWKQECKDYLISKLNEFGCGVNIHISDNYIVVSIPPEILYKPIRLFLFNEKEFANIDFRDCISKAHTNNV